MNLTLVEIDRSSGVLSSTDTFLVMPVPSLEAVALRLKEKFERRAGDDYEVYVHIDEPDSSDNSEAFSDVMDCLEYSSHMFAKITVSIVAKPPRR